MIVHRLRINQLSSRANADYLAYLETIDARDVEGYVARLSEGASMQFNNAAPIVGKAAIRAMLEGYWKSFAAVEHDLRNIYGTDRAFVLEAENHYLRHDGRRVSVRAVAFTDKDEDGLVASVRIYADAAPVFA